MILRTLPSKAIPPAANSKQVWYFDPVTVREIVSNAMGIPAAEGEFSITVTRLLQPKL